MKSFRQAQVIELIDKEPITSQEQLRERLRALGIEVTQATLSRDIRDLGLVKAAADGAYKRPLSGDPPKAPDADAVLRRTVAGFLRRFDIVQQLVVLRTEPAQAQPLSEAIDRARLPDVVGTISGENTVLVICRGDHEAQSFTKQLEKWVGKVDSRR
jgi:transcriptional regulator of arginine metabolism